MRAYPVFLDLRGRTALVLGEGEAAARKAAPLAAAGASIRAVRAFEAADLEGCVVALAAGAAPEAQAALSKAAQARGIPVNVVDQPALCSFYAPAVIDRAPILVAIGSGGAAPVLARLLRQRLEAMLPQELGALAALAEGFTPSLRRRLPDPAPRRHALEAAFRSAAADLLAAGDAAGAKTVFAAALESASFQAPYVVHIIGAGPGDPELLTLRAHRLMGEADFLVHDPALPEALLAMARRDATRVVATPDTPAQLIEMAAPGRVAVWLRRGDSADAASGLAALRERGIAVTTVPGVADTRIDK